MASYKSWIDMEVDVPCIEPFGYGRNLDGVDVVGDREANEANNDVGQIRIGEGDQGASEDDSDYWAYRDNEYERDSDLSHFQETEDDEPDLYTVSESEHNKAAAQREIALSWFGVGSSNTVQFDEPMPSGDSECEDTLSLSEDSGDGGGDKIEYKEFHELDLLRPIVFFVGLKFKDTDLFKRALKQYAIEQRFDFKYLANDKTRVTADCKRKCGWRIHASQTNNRDAIQIKTYKPKHNCGVHHKNTRMSVEYLATNYLEMFRDHPNWPANALKKKVIREFGVVIHRQHAWRVRKLALEMVNGKHAEQYEYARDYGEAILKWNPGSWVKLKMEGPSFQRMYIRFDACKKGFLAGCRPIMAVDACHLKSPYGGQLYVAVSLDGNDDWFPIAIAVGDNECRASWTWFVGLLIEDIGMDDHRAWTFMSDRQKGILDAVEDLVPQAEHRFCVRHLHANFKSKGWKGLGFKEGLWAAARSSSRDQFEKHMETIKRMDENAYKYLENIDVKCWSRHAFRTSSGCDMLSNNISESFNSWIKDSRDKPLLTMLELIRRQIMNRFHNKRESAAKATFDICPKILKKLETSKIRSSGYSADWRTGPRFEVDNGLEQRRLVNIEAMTCSCGRWQLNGIPCVHACAAIYSDMLNPEDFVADCYRLDVYKRVYAHEIIPMPGPKEWPQAGGEKIMPPQIRVRPGRPKKARRRALDEPKNPYKVSRQGYDVKCGKCGVIGHNARSCKQPDNPTRRIYHKRPNKKKKEKQGNDAGKSY